MFNKDIRQKIKNANFKLWQIADYLGIKNTEFSKKLRKKLSDSEKKKIRQIIKSK